MNEEAARHLARAETYLGKGEEYYRKAAKEIVAAKEADHTLSNREVGERFDRTEKWVRDIVKWVTSSDARPTPFAEVTRSSSDRSATKRILAEAPLEQVEQVLADLTDERKLAVAKAASEVAKKVYYPNEPLTDSEQKQAASAMAPLDKAARSFASLGTVMHIQQAAEEINDAVHAGGLTSETLAQIENAYEQLGEAIEFAKQMAGVS